MPRLKSQPLSKSEPISIPDAIRACKTEHSDWKPKEIIEALKASRIITTSQQVSNVVHNMNAKSNGHVGNGHVNSQKQKRKKRPQPAMVALEDLKLARKFIDSVGGCKQARQLVDIFMD